MKEKLYTIDLNDAVNSSDECMFCWLERKLEQQCISFVLGSSYMESDIRERTDQEGFCRQHTKIMYEYGNALGNAWILKSRMMKVRKQLEQKSAGYSPQKKNWFSRGKKTAGEVNQVTAWTIEQGQSCYVCNRINDSFTRMQDTFVYMLKQDESFRQSVMASKGFCLHHFGDVIDLCERKLSESEKEQWIPQLLQLMSSNLDRIQEDINWFIEKYDYCNQDADWKTSRDALPRTMQKLVGGHPDDPVFKTKG